MCGINGIFAWSGEAPPVDRDELIRTRDHMAPRGPDGEGLWTGEGGRIGLGHRRLAIIELSAAGAQPMASIDGRLMLTFNGEIYNYRALRAELIAQGVTFASHSDSEVILALYAREGAAMLPRLRGMFALAIWDLERRELFVARDALGIKPLYYSNRAGTFRFASQVKALAAGGAIPTAIEPAALTGFYLWGSVPEPWTILADVFALPAGSSMAIGANGAAAPVPFHSVSAVYREAEAASAAGGAVPDLAAALLDSARHHLEADVPVGCFLSAGVDSGALLGLMRDTGARDVPTVTLGFDEFAGAHDDEAGLAAQVAAHYGMPHRVRRVSEAEFAEDLPRILAAMDQPTIDGVNSWFVSKAAREMGLKVAVSGLGGDELFGGYPAFRDLPAWTRRFAMARPFGALARQLLSGIGPERLGLNPKAAGMLEHGGSWTGAYLLRRGVFMPWELPELLDRDLVRTGLDRLGPGFGAERAFEGGEPASDFGKVATLEAALYMRNQLLRDTDWASMAHSLEVRVPLVDPVLMAATARAMTAPGARLGKAPLAAAPALPLPGAILHRAKTGFSTPVGRWAQKLMGDAPLPAIAAGPRSPWARRWTCHVAASLGGGPLVASAAA
ncbi:asparagine synthase (glutamine-hydrolyzing) [Sphingomonas canadensis]|uniref:asparagine synthase (glutamine-hydrolyzing) n=1 Tax=Sphingomonas canadensis TaxID=1219257 RepID=A0ABW3H9M7_9SPHN|nr:asparagine synthase (glutamine-hydrolyzing) [Sphingomonas canadensis]MCW3835413.1 asparagine synthase (glutamine-hydrolyzing) [Sphingomonas canadensis]